MDPSALENLPPTPSIATRPLQFGDVVAMRRIHEIRRLTAHLSDDDFPAGVCDRTFLTQDVLEEGDPERAVVVGVRKVGRMSVVRIVWQSVADDADPSSDGMPEVIAWDVPAFVLTRA